MKISTYLTMLRTNIREFMADARYHSLTEMMDVARFGELEFEA